MEITGLPPRTARARNWCAVVSGCTSQSRLYLFGAATRMRSPSIAVTRQGRSQESMAVSGIFPSIVASSRVHKESSIVTLLFGGAARSYTQSYPHVWITGSIPGGLDSVSATSADQVATSHPFRQTRDRRYNSAPRASSACGRRPYHSGVRGRKALTYLDLVGGGP